MMTNTGKPEQSKLDGPESVDLPVNLSKLMRQQLESLARCGVTDLPTASGRFTFELSDSESQPIESNAPTTPTAEPTQSPDSNQLQQKTTPESNLVAASVPALPTDAPGSNSQDSYSASLPLNERNSQLQVLQQQVANCTTCEQLAANRTQTVFGVGNVTPRIVFFGEAPGADEDRCGEPFVGAAGQLLNKILAASKLPRESVYLLNTVKCRPPSNRNPSESELSNCWGYASRQLEILQPEFICCLGSVAARTLLGTKQSLGKLRQQFHQYRGSRVIVTYHPAYLLRTPTAKRYVWDDMKLLLKAMGVDL